MDNNSWLALNPNSEIGIGIRWWHLEYNNGDKEIIKGTFHATPNTVIFREFYEPTPEEIMSPTFDSENYYPLEIVCTTHIPFVSIKKFYHISQKDHNESD